MTVLRWILISVVFLALLFISLQNADPVTVRVFTYYSWQAPLVFVVLIAFAAALHVARLKRQVSKVRREQRAQPTAPLTHPQAPGTGPASGAGFEPPSTGF